MPQDSAKLTTKLNKHKVPELKKMLEERGLPTGGLKAVLVSRLVDVMIKEDLSESAEEKGSQDNAESGEQDEAPSTSTGETQTKEKSQAESPTKAKESPVSNKPPPKEKTPSPEKERSPTPPKRSPSPKTTPSPVRKERTPSPVRKETPSPVRKETPSPVRKERTPSPTPTKAPAREERSPPRRSKEEAKEEPKKRKDQERYSASNNSSTKRQRKWESRPQNDISISSDTLDKLTDNLPQQITPRTQESRTQESRTQDSRTIVRKEQGEQETYERVVPPARKPESRTLFIDRFVRPFLPKHAKELLEKTGEVEYFWMNNIRSHCYVTYKTVEEAKATREAVYGLVWPPANKSSLIAEFSTEAEAARRAEVAKARDAPTQPQQQQPALHTTAHTPLTAPHTNLSRSGETAKPETRDRERDVRDRESGRGERDSGRDRDRLDRGKDRERGVDNRREERQARPPPPPKVTLESLFRKTVARPCIYWLPLTEKEIEERKSTATATKV